MHDDPISVIKPPATVTNRESPEWVEESADESREHFNHMEICPCPGFAPKTVTTSESSVKLIVCLGEYALWAMTGEAGAAAKNEDCEVSEKGRTISAWRGWLLPQAQPSSPEIRPPHHTEVYHPHVGVETPPVLAMYHTAFLFRAPWERTAAARDWIKVGEYLAGTGPESFPEIDRQAPTRWPSTSSFDTEFGRDTKYLVRYSLATRDRLTQAPHLWVVEAASASRTRGLVAIPLSPRVIMHNAPVDLPYLHYILPGIRATVEDSLALHSILWSDLRHNLGYLGSLYARTNRWKHLSNSNPVMYSGGDALGTWDSWMGLMREAGRDRESLALYRQFMRVLPVILRSEPRGSRVHQDRVQQVLKLLSQAQGTVTQQAQAWCGWPINLGSPQQVAGVLYGSTKSHAPRP